MRASRSLLSLVLVAAAGFGITYVVLAPGETATMAQATVGQFGLAGCDIKGNVSIDSGERIYHVPGQRYYAQTIIRPEYGERYFCSEQEARSAGWRRSGV